MRALDKASGATQCAIADLLFLYAHTINWFQAVRDYKATLFFIASQNDLISPGL
jgi:hypothetical protein